MGALRRGAGKPKAQACLLQEHWVAAGAGPGSSLVLVAVEVVSGGIQRRCTLMRGLSETNPLIFRALCKTKCR